MDILREIEEKTLYAYSIVIVLLLFVVISTFDEYNRNLFVGEGGFVETLTVVLYFSCFAYVVMRGKLAYFQKYYYLAALPVLFGLKELDFDSRFTTGTILRTSFYIRDPTPFYEKAIGLIMILVGLANVCLIIKKGSARQVGALLVIALVVISQTLDGISRKVRSIGFKLDPVIAGYCGILEETLELGISMILAIMFMRYFCHQTKMSGILGTETT
jgi:hypothetical protein